MVRSAATLLAAVLLLSDSSGLLGPTFEENAVQVVSTWRTSGAAKIWQEGFVPLEDLTKMSQEVSEHIDYEWHGWVVAGPLPAPPAEARVRWDDGSTMRVPVIAPREALMALSPWPENMTFPDDKQYKLTGATFTTMRLKTSRGMATVPAWRLRFSNLPGPIDYVAVDQKAIGTIEGAVEERLSGEGITDVEVLDERTLMVKYEYGVCAGDEPFDVTLRVSERPDVVVLGLEMPYQGYGFCAGLGKSGRGVVRLDEPLGDRVVLDEWSALPVLCHRAQNTCHAGNG
ncbi:hypothetical protein [Microbispora hainanensis]|uniref:Uncharacterized protein n=1 Tax=Microbispora hainanensis TaxID=568844 RepID=A0A544XRA2_9ACTN|nr:hypothetical protein [Microbispora hainanensis]TQS07025.1 hypothetical protein FLX08_39460 [Microbispora hainanensis]